MTRPPTSLTRITDHELYIPCPRIFNTSIVVYQRKRSEILLDKTTRASSKDKGTIIVLPKLLPTLIDSLKYIQ